VIIPVIDSYPPSALSFAGKRIISQSSEVQAQSLSGRAGDIGLSPNGR
jgi:hypothetical protein